MLKRYKNGYSLYDEIIIIEREVLRCIMYDLIRDKKRIPISIDTVCKQWEASFSF